MLSEAKGTKVKQRSRHARAASRAFASFTSPHLITAVCASVCLSVCLSMEAQVGIGHRFHRSTFARGPVARFMDWCDWMLPEAWDVEHNALHHYELGPTCCLNPIL